MDINTLVFHLGRKSNRKIMLKTCKTLRETCPKLYKKSCKYISKRAFPDQSSLSGIMIGVTLLANYAAAKINTY